MARQSASANASKSKKPSSAKARASAPAGRKAPLRGKAAAAEEARLLDERTRHDIVGVVFAVLAAVLLVAAVLPTDAIVTSFLSTALHLTLGLGAYLLPFLLLAIGVSFLVRFDRERVPARVAVGLALVFFAVLVLLALFTPTPDPHDLSALFDHEQLAARGGYVGAGVAWVGLTLFGQVVSSVIMAGVILAGLAVVGFSLSKLIERVREKRAEREGEDVLDAPPFARVRRGQDLAAEGGDAALVKPAHPLADAAAHEGAATHGGAQTPSARLRASGGLRSGRSSRDGGAHGRLRAPAAFGRGAGAADAQTRPQACRRGCGEGEACRASAWQEGRRRGRPGRGAGRLRGAAPVHAGRERGLGPRTRPRIPNWQETAALPAGNAGKLQHLRPGGGLGRWPHGDALQGRPARRRAREPHHGARAGHRARARCAGRAHLRPHPRHELRRA